MVAAGMQAHVAVLDTDLGRLRELELALGRPGDPAALHAPGDRGALPTADLVVGAVLVPGRAARRAW